MAALIEGPRAADCGRIVLEGDVPIDGILARPTDGPSTGSIVVVPDVGGIRPDFDDLCRRLATHGFAVCAFEPFFSVPAAERSGMEVADRMGRVHDLDDRSLAGAARSALDALGDGRSAPPVAMIGFCMGGYFTFKLPDLVEGFTHAVAFYGMIRTPEAWRGPGLSEPLEHLPGTVPMLAVLGGLDTWTPPDDIAVLRETWVERPDCEIVVYPEAEHGFAHVPSRPGHRADDAADAWTRALRFLST